MDQQQDREAQLTEILHSYLQALDAGQTANPQELLRCHPEFADELAAFFADQSRIQAIAQPLRLAIAPAAEKTLGYAGPEEAPGTLVRYFGNYEILNEIARGGMGVVYRARQLSLNRVVALKMILAGQLASGDEVRRFHAEAQTAAQLQHPNIVAIFEVGEHNGQHYFSMDYVEGRSLAEMVRTAPLAPQQAARYVKLVAGAIHYAHQRGVLHRDLKPSNVLIDGFDQPRVTDFGLARSVASDKGLTATGAIVGTPSYMPPEQASADRGQMGVRSDVYSLGAVLYELITGRPPFRAATPLDTLMQVLSAEPAAPRVLNAAVDRDLETIILKCLAKEPARRYPTAQALSDDLQAFLDGKPIQARRPSLAERNLRWLRQRRQSVKVSLAAAVGSALLLVAAFFGWRGYDNYRQGAIMLMPEGEVYYEAEVTDAQGKQVMQPFTVPTRQLVSMPAGSYEVRLSGLHRLGQTVRLDLARGSENYYTVALNDQRLQEPIACPATPLVAILQKRAALFLPKAQSIFDGHGNRNLLRRLDAATGRFVWHTEKPPEDDSPLWQMDNPWPPREVGDFDGDGMPDVLLGDKQFPVLAVVSGATGKTLWQHVGTPLFDDDDPGLDKNAALFQRRDGFVSEPLLLDKEGDDPALCLVVFHRADQIHAMPAKIIKAPAQRWIEAVNQRTGATVWRRTLDHENPSMLFNQPPAVHATLTQQGGKPIVAVVYGQRFLSLEARTGKPLFEPIDLGGKTDIPARFANLTGNGEAALLWTTPGEGTTLQLSAYATTTGQALWQGRTIEGTHPPFMNMPERERFPDWPLPIDVEGQGRCDVVVLCRQPPDQFGLELLDGRAGATRWRKLAWQNEPPQSLIAGPALEKGRRDLFAAALQNDSRRSGQQFLFVTALAGADGSLLWQQRIDKPQSQRSGFSMSETSNMFMLEPLRWWQPDAHGWPHLVVTEFVNNGQQTEGWLLDGATGRLRATLPGLRHLQTADLDGDGLDDLIGWQPNVASSQPGSYSFMGGGWLHFFRGGVPENWRRFSSFSSSVTHDLDGDGVPDLLQGYSVVSGRTGKQLWSAVALAPGLPVEWLRGTSAADADLKGEGVPALMTFQQTGPNEGSKALKALSGKDGRILWTATDLAIGMGNDDWITFTKWVAARRLTPNAPPSVLFVHERQRSGRSSNHLVVLRGANGKLQWQQEITPEYNLRLTGYGVADFEPLLVDLNGDGTLDLVIWAVDSNHLFEVRALDGRDGHLLWRQAVQPPNSVSNTPPVLCLVPGAKGEPSTILVRSYPNDGNGDYNVELRLLDGREGAVRWLWKKPDMIWAGSAARNLRPVAVCFRANEAPSLAVTTVALDQKKQLWFLNLEGKESGVTVVDPGNLVLIRPPLWKADLRGEGAEQLLFESAGEIQALQAPADKPLWRWSVREGSKAVEKILDILPGGDGVAATVVVHDGASQVVGLNGATGKPAWRCDGPGDPTAVLPQRDGKLPSVLYRHESVTVCRRALPVDQEGRFRVPSPSAEAYPPPGEEPLNLRPLPWANKGGSTAWGIFVPFPFVLLLLWFVRRERRTVLALLLGLVSVTLGLGIGWILMDRGSFEAGQRYDWSEWYLLLGYVSLFMTLLTIVVYGAIALGSFVRGFWRGLHEK